MFIIISRLFRSPLRIEYIKIKSFVLQMSLMFALFVVLYGSTWHVLESLYWKFEETITLMMDIWHDWLHGKDVLACWLCRFSIFFRDLLGCYRSLFVDFIKMEKERTFINYCMASWALCVFVKIPFEYRILLLFYQVQFPRKRHLS